MSQLKRKRETGNVEKFMNLFELDDLRVKTLFLYFDIPVIYLVNINTDENSVRFVS